MNQIFLRMVIVSLLTYGGLSFCESTPVYSVEVLAMDGGVAPTDAIKSLLKDWQCQTENRVQVDGKDVTPATGEKTSLVFSVDPSTKPADITTTIQFRLNCKNKMGEVATLEWGCDAGKGIPNEVGSSKKFNCKAHADNAKALKSLGDGLPINQFLKLEKLAKSDELMAKIKFDRKTKAAVDRDFCEGKTKGKKTVTLSGKVDGPWEKKDYVFHVSVGGHTFDVKSETGVLKETVTFCSEQPEVMVSVTVDGYFPGKGMKQLLNLSPASGSSVSGRIRMRTNRSKFLRNVYFGTINVEVSDDDPASLSHSGKSEYKSKKSHKD